MPAAVRWCIVADRCPYRVAVTDQVICRRSIAARIGLWRRRAERQSVRPPDCAAKYKRFVLAACPLLYRLYLFARIMYNDVARRH